MAVNDIAGLASSATAASLTFTQGAQRAGQQELQIQAQSTGVETSSQTSQTAVTPVSSASDGDTSGSGQQGASDGSGNSSGDGSGRGGLVDITV